VRKDVLLEKNRLELYDADLQKHLCLAAKRFFSSVKSLLFLVGGGLLQGCRIFGK
jgi:hypothetical protein